VPPRTPDVALASFSPTAEVGDEGRAFRGPAEIRTFLRTAGTQFEYTTELLRAERADGATWVAHHRLEGDFPGGVAELAYRWSTTQDLARLRRLLEA
jgi:hypothetical protein